MIFWIVGYWLVGLWFAFSLDRVPGFKRMGTAEILYVAALWPPILIEGIIRLVIKKWRQR